MFSAPLAAMSHGIYHISLQIEAPLIKTKTRIWTTHLKNRLWNWAESIQKMLIMASKYLKKFQQH